VLAKFTHMIQKPGSNASVDPLHSRSSISTHTN
jgi:hypothetical protein